MKKLLLVLGILLTACTPGNDVQDGLITTLEGTPAALEDFTVGKPAVVNFWASWCSFCKDEMPLLQDIENEHASEIAMVGVNLQEEQAVARAYAEAGGYTFVSLLDPGSELKKQFGVFTQPTTFVFDAEGNELHRKDGPFTEEELAGWIEEILAVGVEDPTDDIDDVVDTPEAEIETSLPTPILMSWYEGEVQHTIPLDEILGGGPAKDGIPSIDYPQFVDVAIATEDYDELLGIFVSIEGDARFYPFSILDWHEIVNDTVGGVPISVTYCPLCASAVVYERPEGEGDTTFGVSGFLYQSNLLMYDRVTDSLWDQIRGEAVVGPRTGEKIRRIKSDIISLGAVRNAWPEAKVLSTMTGYIRQYGADPYEGYDQMDATYFPVGTVDEREASKKIIYGIVIDGMPKAYTIEAIKAEERIQDEFGGVRVLIQYDETTERVRFSRFKESGEQEEILPLYTFWFAWVAQYPETGLFN